MAAKRTPRKVRQRLLLLGAVFISAVAVAIGWYFASDSRLRDLTPGGLVCDQRFVIVRQNQPVRIPYCANVNLSAPRELRGISHAVVVVHGSGYRARNSFAAVQRAAHKANLSDKTIILAPQFLKPRHLTKHKLDGSHASWSRWTTGGRSRGCKQCPPRVRSREVIEQMIEALLSRFDLPDLRFLSIVGHSAGGQFVNRFSATTQMTGHGLQLRFIVANPSNFLYFNNKRPKLPKLEQFVVPSRKTVKKCRRYNRYYYGLEKLPSGLTRLGAKGIKQRYAERTVFYLIGANDDDPDHEQLMKTCASQLQGAHRKQRALAYIKHLGDEFGARIAHQRYAVVDDVGHRSSAMLNSPCGVAALFHRRDASCSFRAIGDAVAH